MIELLDIDLDSLIRGTAGRPSALQLEPCPTIAPHITRSIATAARERWFMDEHFWALRVWTAAGVTGARCWHIDPHHDLYGSTDPTVWRVNAKHVTLLGASRITSATYLLAAWRAGLISRVIWLVPEWLNLSEARADLVREMGQIPAFVSLSKYDSSAHPSNVDVTTVAWSRRWVGLAHQCEGAALVATDAVDSVAAGANVSRF